MAELPPVTMRVVVDADDALEKIAAVRDALEELTVAFANLTASIKVTTDQ